MRLAAASRRRWKWTLLATALIAGGGAAGAWAGLTGQETEAVAVLATDLPAGHVISASDVTSVEVAPSEGLRLLAPDTVEGMALTRPVPSGAPLVAGFVSDSALWPEAGSALVAVPVSVLPQGLEAGTTVDLLPAGGADGEEGSGAVTALIHRVATETDDGFGTDQQKVEVLVPRAQAGEVARAVTDGDLQVAVVNPDGQAQDEDGEGGE